MAEKTEKEPKLKQKKGRSKGPKLSVGDFPYVSLMPANRLNAIEVEEAKTKWVKTVGAGVVIAIVLAVASFGFKVVQQMGYQAAEHDANTVEQSILQFKSVDDALSIKNSVEKNIIAGSQNSVNWQDLQTRIAQNLPEGSNISTFNVTTGGSKDDMSSASVYVNVSSLQPIAYAQILDSFGNVPGIVADSLLIGNLTGGEGGDNESVYSYPVAFTMDASILSQRWDYLTETNGAPTNKSETLQEEELPVSLPEETETAGEDE